MRKGEKLWGSFYDFLLVVGRLSKKIEKMKGKE